MRRLGVELRPPICAALWNEFSKYCGSTADHKKRLAGHRVLLCSAEFIFVITATPREVLQRLVASPVPAGRGETISKLAVRALEMGNLIDIFRRDPNTESLPIRIGKVSE